MAFPNDGNHGQSINAELQRPSSVESSAASNIPSVTDDATRPQTAVQSSQDAGSRPPPSRRGPPQSSGRGAVRKSITSERSGHGSNRPQSSASRVSRTHVPTMASHAFFRPMSSQRLQAQRSGRPPTQGQGRASEDGQSDIGNVYRQSLGSNGTVRIDPPAEQDNEAPPPSRGTEFTDNLPFDRATSTASPTGNGTIRSMGENAGLLETRSRMQVPPRLDFGKNQTTGAHAISQAQKSPRSFRSGFRMSSKGETPQPDIEGRERLSSNASTQNPMHGKQETQNAVKSGRNWEYFSGNTAFCWGGRLQNARDRPINIATGVLVVLPAALFFAYS